MSRTLPILAVVLLCVPSLAMSQESPEWMEVVYPVSHLVVPVNGRVGGFTCERELMDRVLAKVAPKSWEHAGGEGTIRYEAKRMTLHVRQTAAGHAELARFLKEIERPQIKITTRLVSAGESIINGIIGDKKWKTQGGAVVALIDDVGLCHMLNRATDDRRTHIMQAPQVTICDGNLDGFDVADDFRFVTGLHPEIEAGKTRLEPTIESKKLGVVGRFRPNLSQDKKSISLDIEMSASNLERLKSTPTELKGVFVSTPVFIERKVAASATIPDRRTLLFRSDRVESEPAVPTLLQSLPYLGPLLFPVQEREPMVLVWAVSVEVVGEEQPDVWRVEPLRDALKGDDSDGRTRLAWRAE